jgi:hypothetical protein
MSEFEIQPAISERIFLLRGQRVMIDRDLAELYGVETKHLNRQVRRNPLRFPPEFMFPLTIAEKNELVTICHRFETLKHSVALPLAFSEHGVAMLASVLNSERAARISVGIVQAFVRLRRMVLAQIGLEKKLEELECRVDRHDGEIAAIFDAIRSLIDPPKGPIKEIGFKP